MTIAPAAAVNEQPVDPKDGATAELNGASTTEFAGLVAMILGVLPEPAESPEEAQPERRDGSEAIEASPPNIAFATQITVQFQKDESQNTSPATGRADHLPLTRSAESESPTAAATSQPKESAKATDPKSTPPLPAAEPEPKTKAPLAADAPLGPLADVGGVSAKPRPSALPPESGESRQEQPSETTGTPVAKEEVVVQQTLEMNKFAEVGGEKRPSSPEISPREFHSGTNVPVREAFMKGVSVSVDSSDRIERAVAAHEANLVRTSVSDANHMTITTDGNMRLRIRGDGAELHLNLQNAGNAFQAEAELMRGEFDAFNGRWNELQQKLSQHGVELGALRKSESPMDPDGHSRGKQDGTRQNPFVFEEEQASPKGAGAKTFREFWA